MIIIVIIIVKHLIRTYLCVLLDNSTYQNLNVKMLSTGSKGKEHIKAESDLTWEIMTTFAPTPFTASKISLAVPGTPAMPVL